MLASTSLALLAGLLPPPQTDQGAWDAPYNHVVPAHWTLNQSGWDGEMRSPFADPGDPHRFMAAHLAVIPKGEFRGKVLAMNWMRKHHINGKQYWAIIDPLAGTPTFQNFELPMPELNAELFCGGHAWTPEGDLLVAGGARYVGEELQANELCYRFVPTAPLGNSMWVRERDMQVPRWYPTITLMGLDPLGNDLMLVSGGLLDTNNLLANKSYEAFYPAGLPGQGRWQPNPVTPAGVDVFDGPPVDCADSFGIYPRDFLLTSGAKFTSGMASWSFRLRHAPPGSAQPSLWEMQPRGRQLMRFYGSSFLVPNIARQPQRDDVVVRAGGAILAWDLASCTPDTLRIPSDSVELCFAGSDAASPSWDWQSIQPLAFARNNPNTTVLPDGTVLISGGRRDSGSQFRTDFPVRQTELFNETDLGLRTVAQAVIRRGYHSAAALLPDGSVLCSGGEKREMDYERYRPPYMTDGSTRPVVRGFPETLVTTYGAEATIEHDPLPEGVTIEHVALLTPAAVTHHADTGQRYVGLEVLGHGVSASGLPEVRVRMPGDSNHAPRGHYMMFLVTSAQRAASRGTPSEAVWVKVE